MEKLAANGCPSDTAEPARLSWLNELVQQFNDRLFEYLEAYNRGPDRLAEAMAYSLRAGGKRIRPALVLLSCECCNGRREQAMPAAAAIEMVHTFSLIHDDLPAMDDDDLRRGRLTNHKVFGEAMAILAGDALLALAFELIGREVRPTETAARQVYELANATGLAGMTGGQALDIQYQNQADPKTVEDIHIKKTAALIGCACKLGAMAADADEGDIEALGRFGLDIGQAFQIADDLLDVQGTAGQAGKRTGKDASTGRPNLAVLIGAEQSRQRADQLFDRAVGQLQRFGPRADKLIQLAGKLIQRSH